MWTMTSLHPSLLDTGHVGVGVTDEHLTISLPYNIEAKMIKVWVRENSSEQN